MKGLGGWGRRAAGAGMTMIIGLALPAAIRLSRIRWAAPPPAGSWSSASRSPRRRG
jgi:hypothetical protein